AIFWRPGGDVGEADLDALGVDRARAAKEHRRRGAPSGLPGHRFDVARHRVEAEHPGAGRREPREIEARFASADVIGEWQAEKIARLSRRIGARDLEVRAHLRLARRLAVDPRPGQARQRPQRREHAAASHAGEPRVAVLAGRALGADVAITLRYALQGEAHDVAPEPRLTAGVRQARIALDALTSAGAGRPDALQPWFALGADRARRSERARSRRLAHGVGAAQPRAARL